MSFDFDKKPFERKHLDTKSDVVTIRMNDDERRLLTDLKDIFRCDADSTTFKKCVEFTSNVIHGRSNESLFRWFSNVRRVRRGRK